VNSVLKRFGEGKFGEWCCELIIIIMYCRVWMILVWRITCDSPNLPNFLPAKLSYYMVHNLCAFSVASTVHDNLTTIAMYVHVCM